MRSQLKGSVAVLTLLSAPAWAQDAPDEAGAMTLQMCAPVVTVTQTPPEVRITMGDDPDAEPQVTVIQSPPTVDVEQCPPTFAGFDGDVQISEAEAEIVVNAADSAQLVVTRSSAPATDDATDDAVGAADAAPDTAEADGMADDAAGAGNGVGEAEAPPSEDPAAAPDEAAPDAAPDETGDQAADAPAPATNLNTEDEAEAAPTEAPEVDMPAADAADAPEADAAEAAPEAANEAPAVEAETGDAAADPAPDAVAPDAAPAETDATGTEAAAPAPDAAEQSPTPAESGDAPGQAILREGNTALTPDEAMTADVEGMTVIASDDETVAEVVSVDPQAGLAVLRTGGFMGLGQRDVQVPLDQILFQRDADGEVQAYLPMTSEEVEDLPEHQAAE